MSIEMKEILSNSDFYENISDNDLNEDALLDIDDISHLEENIEGSLVEDLSVESFEEIMDIDDIDKDNLIRAVLDENVESQKLPSNERAEWTNTDTPGDGDCILKDDALFSVNYKSIDENIEYSGKEFKEHMIEKYGVDSVRYSNNEPDFTPFEHTIDENIFKSFVYETAGKQIELKDTPQGHIELEQISPNRSETHKMAYDEYKRLLGDDVTVKDIKDYMKQNDLTWHEKGDRKTIQMIPSEINQVYRHTGGIGLAKDFDSMSTELEERLSDGNTLYHGELQREPMEGTAQDLENAINESKNFYKNKKREMF